MQAPDAPEIALVELDAERKIYTLGGTTLQIYTARQGGELLAKEELTIGGIPAHAVNGVSLALGRSSLAALTVEQSVMDDELMAPPFGLVRFGDFWRLAGNMIADYLESKGGQVIRTNHMDETGRLTGNDNTYN